MSFKDNPEFRLVWGTIVRIQDQYKEMNAVPPAPLNENANRAAMMLIAAGRERGRNARAVATELIRQFAPEPFTLEESRTPTPMRQRPEPQRMEEEPEEIPLEELFPSAPSMPAPMEASLGSQRRRREEEDITPEEEARIQGPSVPTGEVSFEVPPPPAAAAPAPSSYYIPPAPQTRMADAPMRDAPRGRAPRRRVTIKREGFARSGRSPAPAAGPAVGARQAAADTAANARDEAVRAVIAKQRDGRTLTLAEMCENTTPAYDLVAGDKKQRMEYKNEYRRGLKAQLLASRIQSKCLRHAIISMKPRRILPRDPDSRLAKLDKMRAKAVAYKAKFERALTLTPEQRREVGMGFVEAVKKRSTRGRALRAGQARRGQARAALLAPVPAL